MTSETPTRSVADQTQSLVRTLALTTFLLWVGASSILPLLPEYLRDRGASDGLVGIVMASYFVAALAFQYPAGRLADKIGRRPVLVRDCFVTRSGALDSWLQLDRRSTSSCEVSKGREPARRRLPRSR